MRKRNTLLRFCSVVVVSLTILGWLTGIGAAPQEKDFLSDGLLKMKEKDGRDNALIYYQKASYLLPALSNNESDVTKKILNDGWGKDSNAVKATLDAFQPAFAEVRKGAALDYARNVEFTDYSTPVPNFLSAQRISKMLCVEGRLLESQGRHEDALRNYLTILTMGRDYGSKNALLISSLISIAVESIALRQINRLMISGEIKDAKILTEYALPRLQAIDKTNEPITNAFMVEKQCNISSIRHDRNRPDELKKKLPDGLKKEDVTDQFFDQWEKGIIQYYDIQLSHFEKPYAQRNQMELERKMDEWKASMSPKLFSLLGNTMPNTMEADIRFNVVKSRLHEAQIATALQIFRLTKGRYPAKLTELTPQYFTELPKDVFIGLPYIYQPAADGSSYNLYGVGPDQTDNKGIIFYDPTNGTMSTGDLL